MREKLGEPDQNTNKSRKRVSAAERAGIRADYGKLKWREIQKKYGFTLRTIERVVADLIDKKKNRAVK